VSTWAAFVGKGAPQQFGANRSAGGGACWDDSEEGKPAQAGGKSAGASAPRGAASAPERPARASQPPVSTSARTGGHQPPGQQVPASGEQTDEHDEEASQDPTDDSGSSSERDEGSADSDSEAERDGDSMSGSERNGFTRGKAHDASSGSEGSARGKAKRGSDGDGPARGKAKRGKAKRRRQPSKASATSRKRQRVSEDGGSAASGGHTAGSTAGLPVGEVRRLHWTEPPVEPLYATVLVQHQLAAHKEAIVSLGRDFELQLNNSFHELALKDTTYRQVRRDNTPPYTQQQLGVVNFNTHVLQPASSSDLFAFDVTEADVNDVVAKHLTRLGGQDQAEKLPPGFEARVYQKDINPQLDVRAKFKKRKNGEDGFRTQPVWDERFQMAWEEIRIAAGLEEGAQPHAAGTGGKLTEQRLKAHRERQLALRKATKQWLQDNGRATLVHPLYVNEWGLHPRSLYRVAQVPFQGSDTMYLYLKRNFAFFNLHIEQMLFPFVHTQITGSTVWYIIPHSELGKLYDLAAYLLAKLAKQHNTVGMPEPGTEEFRDYARVLLYSKTIFPSKELLDKFKIKYRRQVVNAGEVFTAHGGYAHFGFSLGGESNGMASNIATSCWLADGPEFLLEYFKWARRLLSYAEDRGSDNCTVAAGLGIPKEFVTNAFNLCPHNFTCSFVSGLLADLKAYLADSEPKQETIADYPGLEGAQAKSARKTLLAVHALVHELKNNLQLSRITHYAELCTCSADSFKAMHEHLSKE
jgi:hypothetical protein